MINALDELKDRLGRGELFCKATDIARLMNVDAAHIRGAATHARDNLPFTSFVIGKNVKFPISCVLKVMGVDVMNTQMLCEMFPYILKKGTHCTPVDLARLFGSDPNTVRHSLRKDPELLGFKVLVSGKRIKVPTIPLIQAMTGVSAENVKAAIAAYFFCFCCSASILRCSSSICRL